MPRRSSGRSSGGRSSWSAPRPAASTPKPAPVQAPAPPPAPIKSTPAGGGLGSVVAEGMAFGGGSAIAHRAVDSMLGPRTITYESVASSAPAPAAEATTMNTLGGSDACGVQSKAFQDCLNYHGSDISKCQFYLDMLSECRKGSGSGLSV
ncbi:Cox19-like CHCH family protein [Forsythia ovata]|uniref:Cox19-like CHCH family protein n=1 Tax=Forsythia ovata TaxID=205694 RepID=A0ABD1UYU5_9LAMI